MPTDETKQFAQTLKEDIYELLGVTPESTESEIRKAYRKASLRYHPDKNRDDPSAADKFHLVTVAQDILTDPVAKKLYDDVRAANERKRRQHDSYNQQRRKDVDDLLRREGAFKRKREDDDTAEARLARRVAELQADSQRRKREMEERNRKAQESLDRDITTEESATNGDRSAPEPENKRMVKVRWIKEDEGATLDKEKLSKLFSRFGKIEITLVLKDRKKRLGDRKEKRLIGNGIVIFESVVGAHAALHDWEDQGDEFGIFEAVTWGAEKEGEPDDSQEPSAADETPPATPGTDKNRFPNLRATATPSTPSSARLPDGKGLRKAPSFASFTSSTTPSRSPGSPSFTNITMMRLKERQKENERKKLEEQIRQQEASDN